MEQVAVEVAYALLERKGANKLRKASESGTGEEQDIQNWAAINRSNPLSSPPLSHLVRDGLVGLDLLGPLGGVGVLARDEQEQRDEAHAREGAGEAGHFF